MKHLTILITMSVLSGCAAQLRLPGLDLLGGTSSTSSASNTSRPDPVAQKEREEAQKRQAEADQKRAEEAKQQREAQEALAKKTQELIVPELGLRLTVPGDVTYKPRDVSAYGSPDFFLEGPASHFKLIVTNATGDRYNLSERITRQQSEYRYGMDVIRQEEKPNGTWAFEFSYPWYFQDGTLGGTDMGYFARKVVGGKKINCLLSGLSQENLEKVIQACDSITPAPVTAAQ